MSTGADVKAAKFVLVTGAGSGMGMESALQLAAAGYDVVGSVLTEEEARSLRSVAEERRLSIRVIRMNVADEASVRTAIAEFMQMTGGRIDALVQFAGMGLRGFFEDLGMDEVRRVFDVNVFGMMAVTQAVLPYMRAAGSGRILLTSSIAGRMGSMSISGYASSKFAVEGWAECLRQELRPFGIWVSLLEPGLIATPHFTVNRNRARRALDPDGVYYRWFCQHESIVDSILQRNQFTMSDVARAVLSILGSKSPRLRYTVGGKAKLIFALRRHLPGEWFETLYWGFVRRMVTKPRHQAASLSGEPPAGPQRLKAS